MLCCFLSSLYLFFIFPEQISRSQLYLIDLIETNDNVDALHDTRDVMDQSTLDPEPFGFSGVFVFTEQYLVIYKELIVNFVLALVAVAILSLFVLGHFTIVLLVCVTVVEPCFLRFLLLRVVCQPWRFFCAYIAGLGLSCTMPAWLQSAWFR